MELFTEEKTILYKYLNCFLLSADAYKRSHDNIKTESYIKTVG